MASSVMMVHSARLHEMAFLFVSFERGKTTMTLYWPLLFLFFFPLELYFSVALFVFLILSSFHQHIVISLQTNFPECTTNYIYVRRQLHFPNTHTNTFTIPGVLTSVPMEHQPHWLPNGQPVVPMERASLEEFAPTPCTSHLYLQAEGWSSS